MWGAASPDASLRSGCRNRSGLTSGNSTEDLAGGLELEKGRRQEGAAPLTRHCCQPAPGPQGGAGGRRCFPPCLPPAPGFAHPHWLISLWNKCHFISAPPIRGMEPGGVTPPGYPAPRLRHQDHQVGCRNVQRTARACRTELGCDGHSRQLGVPRKPMRSE